MIYFNSDYTEGCHPRILKKLTETNLVQTIGYGEDEYCKEAASFIRRDIQREDADVHFLVGGTQTNFTLICSVLRPHEGVISAPTGHINVHETGAVEATGHKILALTAIPGDPESAKAQKDGKITARQIEKAIIDHKNNPAFEHIVKPGMVYISQPTELGTIYSLAELKAIHDVCKQYGLPLFVDGARLGYALASEANDVTIQDLAKLADAFYIGGTKVGLLFGEALVILNPALKPDFRYFIKQKGGMLAKGRLLGVQFGEAFRDGLYYEMGCHAMKLAVKLKKGFIEKGYPLYADSPTNQQFVILPDELLAKLSTEFVFEYQERIDETHSAVRFCTSWATREENIDKLLASL